MTFIDVIAPAKATGAARTMYEDEQKGWGFVPNYAKAFCHRPELMGLWAALQRGIRSHVNSRRFELVTFAAAHALRNSYCSLAHGKRLLRELDEESLRAVAAGDASGVAGMLTEAEQAMMEYARKVAQDASRITAGDVTRLKAHGLTDAEIFDIAAIAAARAFFVKIGDALGVEPDSSFLELEPGLRRALTVGRPISFKPTQQLPEATPVAVAD
jgi:uncharacterized peroxidase-related enzyme